MELNVYLTSWDIFPPNERVLNIEVASTDTLQDIKDRLAIRFSNSKIANFYVVWAGSIASNATRIHDSGLKSGSTICLVPPSTCVEGASTESLKVFQDLQYHHTPSSEQKNDTSSVDLFDIFTTDILRSEVPWKPTRKEIDLLRWAVKALRKNGSPSIRHPVIKWFGEYGCALVSRRTPFEEARLALVCLDKWSFGIHSAPSSRVHNSVPDDHQFPILFVGSIAVDRYEKFVQAVERKLKKVQQRTKDQRTSATGNQGHHKTPGMIHAIMLDALKDPSDNENDGNSVIPKGGFTDVGLHTGGHARSTSWHLVSGLVYHLLVSEDAIGLFRRVLLQLPLRMAEHSVMTFLSEIKDPSSNRSRNSEACRQLTNSIMQTLCHIAKEVEDFAKTNLWEAEFAMFEARCIRVRYELDLASETRANRIADQYLLPHISPSKVIIRNLRLSIPARKEPQQLESRKDILRIAGGNLGLLPFPPSAEASWKDMENWMRENCRSYEGDYVKQQVICKAVENFFFHKKLTTSKVLPKRVEWIMDQYRIVARQLQEGQESLALLRGELMSKELLVVWIAFCLVHQAVKIDHPDLASYSIPLQADRMKFLLLTDITAVDAARQVYSYIQATVTSRGPIFSLLSSDGTLEFALKRGNEMPKIEDMRVSENCKMRARQESRWQEIQRKKRKLEMLDNELRDFRDTMIRISGERERLYEEWRKEEVWNYLGGVAKPQILRDTERQEQNLSRKIASKESEISREEKTPSAIFQPLPSDKNLATKVLFFLSLPSDLQILSRLSFTAQQMLLPRQKTIKLNTAPEGGTTEFEIDSEVRSQQPRTLWYDYYVSGSTARVWGSSVSRNAVVLGSYMAIPDDGKWYSANVRNVSSSSDGVWYPDSLELKLFWNGGGCYLDARPVEGYFNPFSSLSTLITMHKFTENSSAKTNGSSNSLQWALFQHGEDTTDMRGNYALASQDKMVDWLPGKNAFLDFCSMRAYPLQQMRRLCATLFSRCLPLMNKQVRVLMQQTVHQLGGLVLLDEGSEREWHTDLNCFDGWEALRTILDEICEELRSKSREHTSILTVGELSAQASQWDCDCRIVARKLASIAEKAADGLAENEANAEDNDAPNFRARRCILYMSCLMCHSQGTLSRNDVAQMCKALAMADYTRLFEDPTPYDTEIRNLTAMTMSTMAARMSEVLKEIIATPQILSKTVRNVHEAASHEISWEYISVPNGSATTSWLGKGADGHQYFFDLNVGTFLVDGRPPSRLPKPILSSPLYRRTFLGRNFEVVRKSDGSLVSTRPIGGKFYEFSGNDQVHVKEIDGSYPNSSLELLDAINVDSWGSDFPIRLKKMYSHWLCRETNTIVLRPKYFRKRSVHYVLVPQDHGSAILDSSVIGGHATSTGHKDWLCFRIPQHLRIKDWLAEGRDLTNLGKLVYLTDETSKRLLRILRKFERTEGCIETFQTAENSFLVVLPRFGLEFELTEDGFVKSNSFSSFKLSARQNFDDTLLDFSEYLILESEDVKKVLIPAGHVCKDSSGISISGSGAINAIRRFHIYSIHPRFKTLDPVPGKVSIEARLQLAALYTATGTLLPEKRIGQTGAEYAIELMRQSWQNCPTSKMETSHLTSICSYGQLCPTLCLLAFEVFSSSQVLCFLPFGTTTVSEDVPLNITASTEYGLLKGRMQLNPRTLLTEDEETYVLSGVMARPTLNRNQHERDIHVNAISACSIMQEIRKLLKSMLPAQKDALDMPQFPFETSAFGDTTIGAKIGNDLQESWKEYFKLPGLKFSGAHHGNVAEQINSCLVRCKDHRNSMEKELQLSLGRAHGNRMEVSYFNIRKAANLGPNVTQRDLLKIACQNGSPEMFNPFLTPKSCEIVRLMILEWMQLCVMEDKLCRTLRAVKSQNNVEIVRELQEAERSWDVTQHPSWLAFEVEERLQIRDLQYKVADFCLRNPGKITQLNMGEGKTRVILPMLILELAKRKYLMRIHFLSPLLKEAYDFLHHTITASASNRRLLRLPFHRDVKLDRSQAVKLLQCLRRCQDNGGALVVAPEHRLSLLLKSSELDIQNTPSSIATSQELQRIYDLPYFDLFDESDELLHHRYQLIYAAGPCIPLSSGKIRFVVSQAVLQQLQNNDEVAKVLQEVATRDKFEGRLPGAMDKIRLLPDFSDKQEQILVRKLAMAICSDPPYHMRWLKGNCSLATMIAFVTEKDKNLDWLHNQVASRKLSEGQKECLLALRGILAYGLLSHCISLRYRVDYGIDDRRQNRRVAVPYRGSDMPSDRAEYAHPDVLILFTHLAYYYRGLSVQEVTEAVQSLLNLGPVVQREEYRQWFKDVTSVTAEKRGLIDDVDKLDISNAEQMTLMHEVYRFNMAMISFWLDACVLRKETMQFPQRLTANAFHLTDNKDGDVIGFSGTKDNSILLPVQVKQELPDILQVKATDGKMVHLILKNRVVYCLPSSVSLFAAILHMCVEKKASALIDAGALMAGLENEEVATRMVSLIREMDRHTHQGVVFFEKKEASWMVLSLDGSQWPLGSAPIQERDAFVFFDESHCRGADMKLQETASALLTVGPDMCKDKIMQAAGRMRKLDRGQSLMFAVPAEIAMQMPMTDGCPFTSKEVLRWVVGNTVKATAKGLVSWGSQGSLYCTTKDMETRLTDEVLELEELYSSDVSVRPISEIAERTQNSYRQHVRAAGKTIDETAEKMMGRIMERALEYGADQELVMSHADEECEREIEHERELEQEREVMIPGKAPCSQSNWDFDALLHATEESDVLRLTGATSISEAMKGRFRTLKVRGIAWEKCAVFLTLSFVNTVLEEDGSRVQNYSNYLRPVDTVIFFSEGKCCLLLSEWEADKVLRSVWKFCQDGSEEDMRITYTNFAFLFRSEVSHSGGTCLLSIPRSSVARHGVLERASEHTLAGLQLFGGLTMFPGEGRKAALREMLASDKAKGSALRGAGHMIARSDLEEICSLNK